MSEQVDYNSIDEAMLLAKLSAALQKHISNIDNASLLMRNGHFIDAFDRIKGSKEGLQYLKKLLDNRIIAKGSS